MGTINHTPDATQGALIDAANVIVLPDDTENVKADNIQLGDEQLADWVAYRTGGPSNNLDYKITGNGVPPSGGYTPTTRPIIIKGAQGVRMDGSPLDFNATASMTLTPARSFSRPLSTIMESNGTASYLSLAVAANDVGRQGLDPAWHGTSITSVAIGVNPTDDGLTPGTRVQVQLTRQAWSTGVESTVGTFIDTNSSEAYHTVTLDLSGTPHTVDLVNYAYFVKVTGETGGNANTVAWLGSRIGFDMSAQPFA